MGEASLRYCMRTSSKLRVDSLSFQFIVFCLRLCKWTVMKQKRHLNKVGNHLRLSDVSVSHFGSLYSFAISRGKSGFSKR